MQLQRLFIALTLPDTVRASVAALSEPMRGVKWTATEQLHLTLRFIGDTEPEPRDRMIERLRHVRVESFILSPQEVGTFPPNRPPRVVWVGVGSGHPRLFQLRQQIDDAILATGMPLDVKTFHPHITIARCTDELTAAFPRWLHLHREFAAPAFRVDAFDLYSSELRPDGAVHTRLGRFPLA